jgi:hypothetical protein
MTAVATTEYVVLRLVDTDADAYEVVQRVSARDADQAIRKVAAEQGVGTFVATPARSWNPMRVTPKVETTLILEEASA